MFVLLALLFVSSLSQRLDCCVYINAANNTCDEETCPSQCVIGNGECPYQGGDCVLVQRYVSNNCFEGGCYCSDNNVNSYFNKKLNL